MNNIQAAEIEEIRLLERTDVSSGWCLSVMKMVFNGQLGAIHHIETLIQEIVKHRNHTKTSDEECLVRKVYR